MKRQKHRLFFILGMYIAMGASALEIKSVDDKQILKLRVLFENARAPKVGDLINGKQWDCQLFGVRSKSKTETKKNFYQFFISPAELKNKGSQVIKSYQIRSRQIEGVAGPLTDSLRMTEENKLIAELAVSKSELPKSTLLKDLEAIGDSNKTVLAYSLCE